MHPLIKEIVDRGIPVTIETTKYGIGYNVDTGAKSGLTLIENDKGTFDALMRYNFETDQVANFDDVVELVNHCRYGRDFVANHWLKYLIEYGYAERVVKEEISFK